MKQILRIHPLKLVDANALAKKLENKNFMSFEARSKLYFLKGIIRHNIWV
jgi:hypothetical protein